MFTHTTIKKVALVALLAFVLQFASAPSTLARYHDDSDDLPGMHDMTAVFIATGVVAVGLFAYLILKKSKKDKKEDVTQDVDSAPATADDADTVTEATDADDSVQYRVRPTYQPLERTLGMYFNVDVPEQLESAIDVRSPELMDATIKVGLSLQF